MRILPNTDDPSTSPVLAMPEPVLVPMEDPGDIDLWRAMVLRVGNFGADPAVWEETEISGASKIVNRLAIECGFQPLCGPAASPDSVSLDDALACLARVPDPRIRHWGAVVLKMWCYQNKATLWNASFFTALEKITSATVAQWSDMTSEEMYGSDEMPEDIPCEGSF